MDFEFKYDEQSIDEKIENENILDKRIYQETILENQINTINESKRVDICLVYLLFLYQKGGK